MIIRNIASTTLDGRARISAKVVWEDNNFTEREVFFETDAYFTDSLSPDPNAFLLAGIIPAMQFGERRVFVEGRLCPQLREGLNVVVRQLRKWYGSSGDYIKIEAGGGFTPSPLPTEHRTACCMSGGVDSLATFRRNRLDFPLEHPGAVKDLLFIHGFDLGGHKEWAGNTDGYTSAREKLTDFAHASGAELLPVYTNIRFLEEDAPGPYYTHLFVLQSFAACLAACAHAFSPRLTSLLIPSSHEVMDLEPLGSHPLLDPNYTSSSLSIHHDGLALSRMDKMRLLVEWDEGLSVLRVCADPLRPSERMNCGRCEKCLRTKISLLVMGKLDSCPTFEEDDVTADDIERLWLTTPGEGASPFGYLSYGSHHFWEMMIGPVKAMGRNDLADAIKRKMIEYRQQQTKNRWISRIKRYDQRLLGGTISMASRVLHRKQAKQARTGK